MNLKKLLFVFVLIGLLSSMSYAVGWTAVKLDKNHRIMMRDNCIWIEDTSWNALPNNPKIYLEDTNPTFFALVYNALKDFVMSDSNGEYREVYIWYEEVTTKTHGKYHLIKQIQVR